MTEWCKGPLAGFDTETSGKNPLEARLVTASVVEDEPETGVSEQNWLVAVDEPIPAEATHGDGDKFSGHGVTTEHAQAHGEPLPTVVAEVTGLLVAAWTGRIPVVIYNAPYDLTLLSQERARCGMSPIRFSEVATPVLDPLCIDRAMDRYRKGSRTLGAVCKHYGVTLDAAHTSAADSLAAVQVMRALVKTYPKLASTTLQHLYRLQAVWYSQWASNYQGYLRDQAAQDGASPEVVRDITVDQAWPVKAPVEGPMRLGGRQR